MIPLLTQRKEQWIRNLEMMGLEMLYPTQVWNLELLPNKNGKAAFMPVRLLLMTREITTLAPDAMRQSTGCLIPDDIPESCQACKFELPIPPSFIQESDWQHVSCMMCHQVE